MVQVLFSAIDQQAQNPTKIICVYLQQKKVQNLNDSPAILLEGRGLRQSARWRYAQQWKMTARHCFVGKGKIRFEDKPGSIEFEYSFDLGQ